MSKKSTTMKLKPSDRLIEEILAGDIRKDAAEDAVRSILTYIGEDPKREGLLDTPKRVAKAWREMTCGYAMDPVKVLGTDFEKDGYDQMIHVPTIEFVSNCEHHAMPFWGHVWVAYVPRHRVVGLSKVGRLVDVFARRLQIQERMTRQICDTMQSVLNPLGVAVRVKAEHSCMKFRGVMKQDSCMVTTALTGCFRRSTAAREEFLAECR